MNKKISVLVLVIIFGMFFVYIYGEHNPLDYSVMIGRPVTSENHSMVNGVDFTNSTSLSNKQDINKLIFSLMDAVSIPKPELSENIPDATLWISDSSEGITYYKTNIWIGEKAIVIERDTDIVPHQYKEIRDTQYQIFETTLKKYIPENIH